MKYPGRQLVFEREGVAVSQVTSIGEAGSSRDLIDASAHGDDWKDYVLGQQDGDEVPLVLAYDTDIALHSLLVDDYNAAVAVTYGLSHAESGFAVEFDALITQLSRGGARDGLLQLSATLKIVEPGVVDTGS